MTKFIASVVSGLQVLVRAARKAEIAEFPAAALCALAVSLSFVSQQAQAQNLDAEPRFESIFLSSGFSTDPNLYEMVPGGTSNANGLPPECVGYINPAQPDFRLSFQAGSNPLSIVVNSSADTTLMVNDPLGTWHCNDDAAYLSDTNPGVQIDSPLPGDYNIWVGTYEQGEEPLYTILAISEQPEEQWASLDYGLEDMVLAMSFDGNGDILFGDDSGIFANDGECDDPRFEGTGAAFGSSTSELFADATDCQTEFEAGRITMQEPGTMFAESSIEFFEDDADLTNIFGSTATPAPLSPGEMFLSSIMDALQSGAADAISGGQDLSMIAYTEPEDIDFGDDASMWANDGECDDPRFAGEGMASFTVDDDLMHDATDCQSLYLEGGLTFLEGEIIDPNAEITAFIANSEIDFGDNSSVWSDDGECDDPRFSGPGVAAFTDPSDAGHDANDCARLFMEGGLTYDDSAGQQSLIDVAEISNIVGIDFGDNSSVYADDGECDDPRFTGPGAASFPDDSQLLRDANDCASLYIQGELTFSADGPGGAAAAAASTADTSDIDFGDVAGDQVSPAARPNQPANPVNQFAENPAGLAASSQVEEIPSGPRGPIDGATQPDGSIYASGTVYGELLDPGGRLSFRSAPPAPDLPPPVRGTPSSLINFGDNSSVWADDGECDDPRFEGEGMAAYTFDEDIMKDANDCKAAYDIGAITLKN